MAVLAPTPPGPLEQAELLALSAGGAESNVAQYLAGHGVTARWVSRIGADPFGRMICRRIGAGGVDVSGVVVDPDRPTGVYFKERGHVHYYRRGSAASALSPAVLDTPAVATADALHLTGITPALSESCRELVVAALEPGPRRRPLVSFDLNWRPALWRGCDGADLLRGLANFADVVFVGQDEATTVWGCRDAEAVRALLPDPPVLVVKDAERGATAFHQGSATTVPSLSVDVVDVVGAGDAFAAGYLTALFAGRDPVGQLRLGHLTAAAALRSTADHGPLLDPAIVQPLLAADADAWSAATIPILDTV
jgi:2-dehydro-3-deoxygluconokinase